MYGIRRLRSLKDVATMSGKCEDQRCTKVENIQVVLRLPSDLAGASGPFQINCAALVQRRGLHPLSPVDGLHATNRIIRDRFVRPEFDRPYTKSPGTADSCCRVWLQFAKIRLVPTTPRPCPCRCRGHLIQLGLWNWATICIDQSPASNQLRSTTTMAGFIVHASLFGSATIRAGIASETQRGAR